MSNKINILETFLMWIVKIRKPVVVCLTLNSEVLSSKMVTPAPRCNPRTIRSGVIRGMLSFSFQRKSENKLFGSDKKTQNAL